MSGPDHSAAAPEPWRDTVVDVAALLGLAAVCLAGLATTFTGAGFWLVGTAGLVVGAALAVLVRRRRWPVVAALVLAVVALLLLGGPLALRSQGRGAWLPLPDTLALLVDRLLHGWKDLLTTLPPVDGAGPLLVLPLVLGLTTGVLGVLLAGVRRGPVALRAALPLLPVLGLLAAVILLGVRRPQSLWLQGVVVAAVGLAWLAERARRAEGLAGGAAPLGTGGWAARLGRLQRPVVAGGMVALAALLAHPLAAAVTPGPGPTGDDADRVVLRTYVQPPFDVDRYPSPLAAFRRYVEMPEPDAVNLWDTTLVRLEGAPPGSRLRIAALDHYDGIVWGASDGDAAGVPAPGGPDDSFQRVSTTIDNPADGDAVTVEATVGEGWSGPWLPTVGALRSLEFEGDDAEARQDSFRYDLATATAVVPAGLAPGDRYRFTAVRPAQEVTRGDEPAAAVGGTSVGTDFLDTAARRWSAGAVRPVPRVLAIAEHLRSEGRYSDGVRASERIYHPGHHLRRLDEEFVDAPVMVGNDEQYAAVMALLAQKVGVPSRVVLGAVVPEDGVVQGRDVQAWVELQVADGSWRTLPTEAFMDEDKPAEQPPLTEREMSGSLVPPPAPIPPPSTLADQDDTELRSRDLAEEDDAAGGWPAWVRWVLLGTLGPVLLVLLAAGLVVAAKAWRRRRRRTAAVVSARVVGAWAELVDHARDLGRPVPVGAARTRREQAGVLGTAAAPALARRADGHVFGRSAPGPDAARTYWDSVDAERRSMSAAVGRWDRTRAAVSLASLRHR